MFGLTDKCGILPIFLVLICWQIKYATPGKYAVTMKYGSVRYCAPCGWLLQPRVYRSLLVDRLTERFQRRFCMNIVLLARARELIIVIPATKPDFDISCGVENVSPWTSLRRIAAASEIKQFCSISIQPCLAMQKSACESNCPKSQQSVHTFDWVAAIPF